MSNAASDAAASSKVEVMADLKSCMMDNLLG
jgi:hypothetical protein